MARPKKNTSIEEKILKAEQKAQSTKLEYETACSELKSLFEERNRIQADKELSVSNSIDYNYGIITITDFGERFLEACM